MKEVIKAVISSEKGITSVPLRVGAGVIFMAHGAQKLFGWFSGYGLEGTGGWMESIGLAPGYLMALMAGGAEFFGGLFLVFGLLVRPSAVVLALTMLVAIFAVHFENGLFMANNGYEFGLSLLVISIALAIRGAGSFSLDRVLQQRFV